METVVKRTPQEASTHGIVARTEFGMVILSPAIGRAERRILYVNSYGGSSIWKQVKEGTLPSHHLWGVLQLVRMGYEIALAEPLPDFYLYRNPFPHDLRLLKVARSWLGRDGVVYCGHNVLYWLPFLKAFGAVRGPVVSLLFAKEPLDWSRAHTGIIALTGAAAEQARKLSPKAKVAQLAWGADLDTIGSLDYRPEWFLSCGVTMRDHRCLAEAAALSSRPVRLVGSNLSSGISWPSNVSITTSRSVAGRENHYDFLRENYGGSIASIIPVKKDPERRIACGFTELLEAMATSRPVIVTNTGALPTEVDVEASGCGLFVPPEDPKAMARAMEMLAADPAGARGMGEKGRQLAEERYNMNRFVQDLHAFFIGL